MKCLVVEDERALAGYLAKGLGEEGYSVDVANSKRKAEARVLEADYDLILLDLFLPDGSGLDLLRQWREVGMATPILVLSARDAIEDKVRGLDLGADGYLTKPFSFDELTATARSLLRRHASPSGDILTGGDVQLDLARRRVTRAGRELTLTQREFELLEFFLRHPNVVLSRWRIAEEVWGSRHSLQSNVIDVLIGRLRKKFEDVGEGRLIETVKGEGYIMVFSSLTPESS